VDISHLELGKHLRVSEVNLGDKVKVLTDADLVIAHVVLPRAEVVAETAAVEVAPEAGAAEPEVIKKGKTEKAEGEADEKADKGAKPEKADKGGKPERGDKGGKPERGEKKERK